MPARAPASMLMLHSVIRPSIESARTASPAYSIVYPLRRQCRSCRYAEGQIFRGHTFRQQTARLHFHRERFVLRQTLCRQHVLDFARADAKRERAKRAVGARVTIATDDRHARARQTKLRSNDVNDALFGGVNIEELNAKLFAVVTQCLDLLAAVASAIGRLRSVVGTL